MTYYISAIERFTEFVESDETVKNINVKWKRQTHSITIL